MASLFINSFSSRCLVAKDLIGHIPSPAWTGAITARGALIYDVTTGAAVCVLDFGNNVTSTSTFTVTMPANTSSAALIRLV